MDPKINSFLQDLKLLSPDQLDIVNEIRDLFKTNYADLKEKFIYGGIGFYIDNQLIGGAYAYKQHVSLVLGRGNELKNIHSFLEGGGKFRRHLKIFDLKDLVTKNTEYYVKQVIELAVISI